MSGSRKYWKNFSNEKLKQIFLEENTFEDVQNRFGYSYRAERNLEIKELAKSLNIDISYYTNKKGTNLINKISNHLKVLRIDSEKSDKGDGTFWLCECLDCGKIISVRGCTLNHNKQINCGCTKKLNLIGQKFGKLTVLEEVGVDNHRNITYRCKCDCGKETIVPGTHLKSGNTKSCGCYWNSEEMHANRREDLTGKVFGYLQVLEYDQEISKQKKAAYWRCKCLNCGAITSVRKSNLIKGQLSCGCIRSKGEKIISELLQKYKIPFKKEVSFNDLIDNGKLRYDFGIYDENNKLLALIEYNGIQHYKSIPFFGGESQLKIQQERDLKKQNYCKNNNIPLIIFNNLEDISIEKIYEVIK